MRQTVLSLGCCLGISINALQALTAFSQMQINWIEPNLTLMNIVRHYCSSASVLARENASSSHYLDSLLIFLFSAGFVMLLWIATHCFGRGMARYQLSNSVGFLFMVGYLALAILSLAPF